MVLVTINSKLYSELFSKGGDDLIAVYLTIKKFKGNNNRILPIRTKNNRVIKHYRLLQKTTGITIKKLQKYTPVLLEMKLCNFSKDGGFYLKGNNKINSEYKKQNGRLKFIKIQVFEKISATVLNSFAFRLQSLKRIQSIQIEKKRFQINTIRKVNSNVFLSKKEYRAYKNILKKNIKIDPKNFCDKNVLSNKGFASLKNNEVDNKSKGFYWKKKLVQNSIIKTKRIFSFVAYCDYSDYRRIKIETNNVKLVFKNGSMYEESISEYCFL